MSEIKNVTLSFPCNENWDSFEKVSGGRLCTNCAHVVRDFRDCSMEELKEAMKSGHACGLFRASQLSKAFVRTAAVVAVTAMTGCQTESVAPEPTVDPSLTVEIEGVLPDAGEMKLELVTLGIVIGDSTEMAEEAVKTEAREKRVEMARRAMEERRHK